MYPLPNDETKQLIDPPKCYHFVTSLPLKTSPPNGFGMQFLHPSISLNFCNLQMVKDFKTTAEKKAYLHPIVNFCQ